jgi:transposase InsO family protein
MTGIRHRYTRPYRPQTNGKIERFWRTLKEECFSLQTQALTPRDFEAELQGFMYRYNYQRRHSALAYQTLFDKLKNVTRILT